MSIRVRILRSILFAAVVLTGAACDDQFAVDPLPTVQDTTTLFSLSRPDLLGRPSAYDFVGFTPVRVEAAEVDPRFTLRWDVALAESGGRLAFVPASAFPGIDAETGIAVFENQSFESVTSAPRGDDAYTTDAAVPARAGVVYVVRTRRYSSSCVRYAKVRPLQVDARAGLVEFEFLESPNCNDRSLVPDEED